jgi:hypothetical protein
VRPKKIEISGPEFRWTNFRFANAIFLRTRVAVRSGRSA